MHDIIAKKLGRRGIIMKILKSNLKNDLNLRSQLDFPTDGVEFIDITPLIIQKEVLKEITDCFVEHEKTSSLFRAILPS